LFTLLFFSCSLLLVYTQPGTPVPNYFVNVGDRLDAIVWPKIALQAGYTYSVGAAINNGYYVNLTFTMNSGCTTSFNSVGPSGNQGWWVDVQYSTTTSELAAIPSPGINVWTGPTDFGGMFRNPTRAYKVSFTFNYFDVCNCVFVNYISFTTTDSNTTGTYNAHYWNNGLGKRGEQEINQRNFGKRSCPPGYCGMPCPTGGTCCFLCPALTKSSSSLASWATGNPNPTNYTKRTNFYNYWISVNQAACTGIPNVGSYGNGTSGAVKTSSALGVTYM